MKIYHRKNFLAGLVETILGLLNLPLAFLNEFERNQLVQLKSLSKSFQLTRWISFAMMLAFLAMGKLSGEMSFIGMAVGIALVFPVSLFVEMGTFLYYESRE